MEPTTQGNNRTGTAASPDEMRMMIEAVQDLSPEMPISIAGYDAVRAISIREAENVGSIPRPAALLKGTVKKSVALLNGINPAMLLNKIGERMAFERSGTRIYDALIAKYLALSAAEGDALPAVSALDGDDEETREIAAMRAGEQPLETLRRIRAEEQGHYLMLCESVAELGGDPSAQTPCADVAGTATMGVMQVVSDPRTTLAQSLDAVLVAELTDTASWELLSELAARAGQGDMCERFLGALAAEQEHLIIVQGWLRELLLTETGTAAV